MRLYFNGCSHTYGDDLKDKQFAWPALIAKNLNAEFINDSIGGGTNDRILYRVIKNASDYDKIFIAWTYTNRFTRYSVDNNDEVNFNPQLGNKSYGNHKEFKEYGKLHYAYWNNELYNFKLWLQQILLVQRYLDSIKKPYVMLNASNNYIYEWTYMINSKSNVVEKWTVDWNFFKSSIKPLICFDLIDDDQLGEEYLEIKSLIDQINFTNYIGWNTWCMHDIIKKYPLGPTNHALEEGHKAISDYILDYLKEKS